LAFEGRIGHIDDIHSPWANAGGVVKTYNDAEVMARTGVGYIEYGTVTIERRPDLSAVGSVYYHDAAAGFTYNRKELDNVGIDAAEPELKEAVDMAHTYGKKIVANVAPVSSHPASELAELITRTYRAGVDGVLINPFCPNVEGVSSQLAREPDRFINVLESLKRIIKMPLWVRIGYSSKPGEIAATCNLLRLTNMVSAVCISNSESVAVPTDMHGNSLVRSSSGLCGRSGPGMAEAGYAATREAARALYGSGVHTVSCIGISNADELQRRLDVGAVAGAGSTFFMESPNGWADDTQKLLVDLAA
jgi:dihydroorotate dehydrogenase